MASEPTAVSESERRLHLFKALFVANTIAYIVATCLMLSESFLAAVIGMGIVFAQASLLAIWAALGTRWSAVRIAASLAMLIAEPIPILAKNWDGPAEAVAEFLFLGAQWTLLFVPLFLWKWFGGLRLGPVNQTEYAVTPAGAQFNLRQLLLAVTLAGGLFAAVRVALLLLAAEDQTMADFPIALYVTLLGGNLSIAAPLSCAALMLRRAKALLIASVAYALLIGIVAGAIFSVVIEVEYFSSPLGALILISIFLLYYLPYYGWLLACLLLTREAGFRLMKVDRLTAARTAA